MKAGKDIIQPERKTQSEKLDTYIGEGTVFDGRLSSKEDIRIYGNVKGTIECQGRVMIGESGRIEADILTNDVVVSGTVVGNVTAESKLEVASSGTIQGNIKAARLVMEDGSKLHGNCEMLSDGKPIAMEEIEAIDADALPVTVSEKKSKVASKESKVASDKLHN